MEASLEEPEYDNRRDLKLVHDNVHGDIHLDRLSLQFVDTQQFQRLRDLKQLGLTYMVYPGAVHSRFEHSLGVYFLASDAVNRLKDYQGTLGIEQFDIKTVKLAGLLHDVGHGPFSHMFERNFLPQICDGLKWSHEEMSLKLIRYIVDENYIEIDDEIIRKVQEMVVASENATSRSSTGKSFLYDIVANGRNGIDVDKFDYIVRDSRACGLGCNFEFQRLFGTMKVIDDEICYETLSAMMLAIFTLFAMAIELMVVDAMIQANSYLDIASSIDKPDEFWKLDDTILKKIETSKGQELEESRDLIRRIRKRDLYQFCNEFAVPKEMIVNFKPVTAQDIICSQDSGDITLKEEDIAVTNVKIDLTRGKDNPLEIINFFEDYDSTRKFKIKDYRVSHMLPAAYQDLMVRVYSKKAKLVGVVSKAFKNYQLRTYGNLIEVHPTPQKKQQRRLNFLSEVSP